VPGNARETFRGCRARLNLPTGPALPALVAAASLWVGALSGGAGRWALLVPVAVAGLGAVLMSRGWFVVGFLVAVGVMAGLTAAERSDVVLGADVPQGPGVLSGVAKSDSRPYGERYRFVLQPTAWTPDGGDIARWQGPPVAVISEEGAIVAGDVVDNQGLLRSLPDLIRGDPVAGRMVAQRSTVVGHSTAPLLVAGNYVRSLVESRLATPAGSSETALLAGFLIGDTSGLPDVDYEALRRSGLTHFVAVSGSNVALVLAAWWLVIGPLGAGVRIRAVTGLIVLAVFVVVTRWESSVIRAATMAGIVLGGRALAIPIDAWTALGVAVSVLLAASGDLAYDVGFQLSVAATAGVLAGMHWWRDRAPRFLWGALAATVSAQLAVAPLLLVHFGSVPLLSPLANVLAAPLVTAATSLAGVGVVTGWTAPLHVAEWVAGVILSLARVAGEWPQLGLVGLIVVALVAGLALVRHLRPVVLAGVILCLVVQVLPPGPPEVATVVFLDVGQGDAILLQDPTGATALIDSGRDPAVLAAGLRRHGVTRLDLAVATHGDADHVGGFAALTVDVDRLWVPANQPRSDLLDLVVAEMTDAGAVVDEVAAGESARMGSFEIDVIGPRRRYAAENDGSVVLFVNAGGATLFLGGDIEATAQAELPPLHPDVLLVPHHGAATTDLGWLSRTVGSVAVISVGPNDYGHPDPLVVETLDGEEVTILMTQQLGDVSLPLGR
jgi:competence protein ComEC